MSLTMKRNIPILVLLAGAILALVVGLGGQRVIAYTVKGEGADALAQSAAGTDYTNPVALFDDGVVHSIQLILSDADYQSMITTYQQTGEKEYFHADVVIDGVRVNNVGVRLKGNASLRTAVGGGRMRIAEGGAWDMQAMQGGQLPEGFELPEGMEFGQFPEGAIQPPEGFEVPQGGLGQLPQDGTTPVPGATPETGNQRPARPGGDRQPGGAMPGQGGFPGGMGGMGEDAETLTDGVSEGENKIPLLIKFDEFEEGQTYQGYTRLAIRTYGTSQDAAMLQEPLTNAVARLAGLPVTQTAFTGFRLNNGAETLYSISEVIDEDYLAKYFEYAGGVLYKSEVGATLSYKGDDPTGYTNSFTQETRENDADFAPLIDFIRFLDESDDATFEAELPDYLDVDAFATYLALNNLLVNADSLVGMGNNYYLYWDDTAERFTLLMWDANESMGKLGMGNISTDFDIYYASAASGVGPMMRGGTNVLFERFMATPSFKALYEQKLVAIYQAAFASGALQAQLEQYVSVVRPAVEARGLASLSAYDTAASNIQKFIALRGEYLAGTELLGE